MVVHGAIMFTANAARSLFLLSHVRWRALTPWAMGAAAAVALFFSLAIHPSIAAMYLVLGGIPLVVLAAGRWVRLDFLRPSDAFLCGLAVTNAQLFAGASGPLQDLFFLRSSLTRHQVVATKSVMQTGGHVVKVIYYYSLANMESFPLDLLALSMLAAILGTRVGKNILLRIREEAFRALTEALVVSIALVFACRGLWVMAG